jgi:diketogulonate reductase-like aldo/keto reductase
MLSPHLPEAVPSPSTQNKQINMSPTLSTGITPVFGAASFSKEKGRPFATREAVASVFDVLAENDIKNIDTAQIYGAGWSEEILGECGVGDRFIIDTKAYGGIREGSATEVAIVEKALESVKKLGVKKVCTYLETYQSQRLTDSTTIGRYILHPRSAQRATRTVPRRHQYTLHKTRRLRPLRPLQLLGSAGRRSI